MLLKIYPKILTLLLLTLLILYCIYSIVTIYSIVINSNLPVNTFIQVQSNKYICIFIIFSSTQLSVTHFPWFSVRVSQSHIRRVKHLATKKI